MTEPVTDVTDAADAADHVHVVHNGKRALTLDELALTQPGMDRLMAELGPRLHRLYYAGAAGNWRLADYFYKSIVKQLRLCGFSRPKYADDIAAYVAEDCEPVKEAVKARDADGFAAAYQRMVDRANHYHVEWKKPYIVWRTPPTPPDDLDLTAGVDD